MCLLVSALYMPSGGAGAGEAEDMRAARRRCIDAAGIQT